MEVEEKGKGRTTDALVCEQDRKRLKRGGEQGEEKQLHQRVVDEKTTCDVNVSKKLRI